VELVAVELDVTVLDDVVVLVLLVVAVDVADVDVTVAVVLVVLVLVLALELVVVVVAAAAVTAAATSAVVANTWWCSISRPAPRRAVRASGDSPRAWCFRRRDGRGISTGVR
jgi:hypothetical protein